MKNKIERKWEYKIIQLPQNVPILPEESKENRQSAFDEWEKELDELGEEGWEIISVFDWVEDYPTILLKRIKNDFLHYTQGNIKK